MNERKLREFIRQVVLNELLEAIPPPIPAAARRRIPSKTNPQATHELSLTPLDPSGKWETGNLVQDAQKVVETYKEKLKSKKGIDADNLSVLGEGTAGVAFDLGNKVLKVTTDVTEAKASNIVMGKRLPNIIEVYDVWKFPDVGWYGLIIEKVTELSAEEGMALTKAVMNTKFPLLLRQAGDDWNAAMQLLAKNSVRGLLYQAYIDFPDAKTGLGIRDPRVQEEIKAGVKKTIDEFNKITEEYKMKELFKSLESLGIQFYDFHGGNYGRRSDGTLVLFDLGRSISQGTLPAELAEKFALLETVFGKPARIKTLGQ